MATGWQRDKERTDPFMPAVKSILGRALISDAPIEIDQRQATDLLVLTLAPYTIGVRIRDADKYLSRFPFDITVRYSRPSGAQTEWDKIVEGWCDFIFYGFGDFQTYKLAAYTVLNLKAFRALLIRAAIGDAPMPLITTQSNGDQSSTFKALDWRTVTPECIKHQYPAASAWRQFSEGAA
jgi:hypothetical protein